MSERASIRVAAAVIPNGGTYLMTQRPAGSHGGGFWEFPGGKIEAGESPAEALVRELREELGVEVETGALLSTLEHAYPDRHVELHFLEATIVGGEPQALEVADLGWFTPAEMPGLPVLPADAPLVEMLASRELERQAPRELEGPAPREEES